MTIGPIDLLLALNTGHECAALARHSGTFPLLWRRFQDISESVGRSGSLGNDVQRRIRGIYYDTTLTDDPSVL